MRGSLPVVFLIVFFAFITGQQVQYRKFAPKPSEVPRAGRNCLNKQKLHVSTVAGDPAGSVSGSALVSCRFHTVDCRGVRTPYYAEPKPGGVDVCDGWEAARNAIAGAALESCCDPESVDELPPADETAPENCPSPTSWFDNSASCKEKQAPRTAVQGRDVVVRICGIEVFRVATPGTTAAAPDPEATQVYRSIVRNHVQSQIGSTVCCDKFRDAVRTGVPCNPANDMDCDGIPNGSDTLTAGIYAIVPDINVFGRPAGARIDPFPAGLDPDDTDFLPNRTARNSKDVGDCPCKWDLVKGELKCGGGPDGKHVYLATWRCPTTKAEVITTKYASATTTCP